MWVICLWQIHNDDGVWIRLNEFLDFWKFEKKFKILNNSYFSKFLNILENIRENQMRLLLKTLVDKYYIFHDRSTMMMEFGYVWTRIPCRNGAAMATAKPGRYNITNIWVGLCLCLWRNRNPSWMNSSRRLWCASNLLLLLLLHLPASAKIRSPNVVSYWRISNHESGNNFYVFF